MTTQKQRKCFCQRRGPMRVIEVDKDSITLLDLNDNLEADKVHVSLCARWIQGSSSNLTPLEAAKRDTGSYIVEKILDH